MPVAFLSPYCSLFQVLDFGSQISMRTGSSNNAFKV